MSLLAFALVLCAAVAHASWNVVAHGASRAGFPFLWWGAVASTVIWAVAIPFTGGLGTDDLAALLRGGGGGGAARVSGVLHVGYMLVLQRGYQVGNLSTVYATARGSGPFLSVIVAIGLVDRVGVERLDGSRRLDPGLVFGLLTGVTIAIYTIWDAFAVRQWSLSPVAFMVGTTLLQIPFYSIIVRRRWDAVRELGRREWKRILAFGILSPLSYILVLHAITIAPVALVAPLREVSVVLVSLFGAFVLREGRLAWRIVSSCVVVAGIALLAV